MLAYIQPIVQFDIIILFIGFLVNLMVGGGIVYMGFTIMSESLSFGAMSAIILSLIAILVEWVSVSFIRFETVAQINTLQAGGVLGAAIGAIVVFSVFEPQTQNNAEEGAQA